jgi:hypothetical protein
VIMKTISPHDDSGFWLLASGSWLLAPHIPPLFGGISRGFAPWLVTCCARSPAKLPYAIEYRNEGPEDS